MTRMMGTAWAAACVAAASSAWAAGAWRSAYDAAYSPDGQWVGVSDRTGGQAAFVDPAAARVVRQVPLNGKPCGVAWAEGRLLVAEYDAAAVAEVDAAAGKVLRRFAVGPKPIGVAVAPRRRLALVTDHGLAHVGVVDLAAGKEIKRIGVLALPQFVAVTPDESLALVGNLIPVGDAMQGTQSAAISVIDLEKGTKIADIKLPPGCTNVRQIRISRDGRWAYVAHTLGRFTLPTTQLERGWVNTNGLTILDLVGRKVYATVLLDQLSEGAADPWGVALSPDESRLWVTLAGIHQLAEIKLADLHLLMAGTATNSLVKRAQVATIWPDIAKDGSKRDQLQNDLAALYAAGLIDRRKVPGQGPRGVAVSPDGRQVAVAQYFSGDLLLVDAAAPATWKAVSLGAQPAPDEERRGEVAFHSAELCFQHWLSCATCHPDGRADGLNWDLLNDGIGNPKNTKSLVLSHRTPPVMSLGVRESMEEAVDKGFRFIQFRAVADEDLKAVQAYVRALAPEASPYLVDGKLSAQAQKGKALFESPRVGCAECHPAPLYTGLKLHDVGTMRPPFDKQGEFDTPTCLEMWRTAPYLHSGDAATLADMLTTLNKGNKHGTTSHLSKEDLDALVEYLLSL